MCEECGKPWSEHTSLMRGMADVRDGRVSFLGSFAQYAESDD